MKKIMSILFCILLAISIISCQNHPSNNSVDSSSNKAQQEEEKQKNNLEKEDVHGKNAIASEQKVVHPLICDELKQVQSYKIIDYQTKKDIQNDVLIRIPQIDFKTEDAEKFNRQMREFAKAEYERYQWYALEKVEWEYDTDYRFFTNEEIVSIILFQKYARLDQKSIPFSEYDFLNIKSVNFNAKTGKLMSDDEVLQIFKISNYEKKILSAIYNFGKGFRKRILESTPPEEKEQIHSILSCSIATSNTIFWRALYHLENRPNTYYDMSEHNDPNKCYWLLDDSEYLNKLPQLYYNGEEKALFASIKIGTPAGAGFYYRSVNVETLENKEPDLNPVYAHYANEMDIDLNSEEAPILMCASLGYIGDEKIFKRLQSMKNNANLDLEELLDVKISDYKDGMTLPGEEFFVVIPKYNDISLCFSHIIRDAENKEHIHSFITLSGNVLLKSNPSDLYPNCEIQINYRDRLVKYRPHISLIDGSNEVGEDIMDVGEIIEAQLPNNVDDAMIYLKKLLPKG